jgi:Cu2+-exporting ATPase
MNAACWHCGEALPANPPKAVVAGVAHDVCCNGCRAAAEWIDKLGLADYYRLRSETSARAPDPQAAQRNAQAWARPELSRHVVRTLDAGHSEALLLVDGIRCAACVWLIERALGTRAGIVSVQVNAAAQRARVVWNPAQTDLSAILAALAQTGYSALPLDAAALDDARRREARAALKRLAVAGFGAMQAMMYASALYLGAFTTMDAATREAMRWLGLLVATPVVFYSARPFFAGALRALRARTLGMDVPVALAIALIYAASVFEAMRGNGEVYFDSVSMFVFFLLAGRYLEMRARHRAGNLADAMARLAPAFADRIGADGTPERIAALELGVGDRVQIAQGERVPADAVLESAVCGVDESLLSGESLPVRKVCGDALIGGSLLLDGPVRARVTRVGADTALAGIAALVARAQSERPRLAQAGERAAAGFVARVLALAVLCAIGWSFVDPSRALAATLAVLVVSCPCAFALAVPAALTRALSVLAARGVFVVHTDAIENLALATHAVFDKTGTLTDAELELARVDAADRDAALALAAALARGSRHPVAQTLARAASDLPQRNAQDVRSIAGSGIEGTVDGRRLRLGQPAFALDGNASDADALASPAQRGKLPDRAEGGALPQQASDADALASPAQRGKLPDRAEGGALSQQVSDADALASPAQRGKLPDRAEGGDLSQQASDADALASPAQRGKLPDRAEGGDLSQQVSDADALASPAQRGKLPDRAEGGDLPQSDFEQARGFAALPPSAFGTFPRRRGKEKQESADSGFETNSRGNTDFDDDDVVLAENGKILAAFGLRERVRAGAREALDALRADGMSVELASGDAPAKVEAVAQRLGIETRHARMSPADKLERLRTLRANGARVVAMGDGINDAPVLAGADVAIALASGSELAQAAGDIVLDGTHLPALAQARGIARETLKVLRQNQRWALVYNLAVVPLGALGFVPPWLAAIGMSASSLVVILNALRIGRSAPVRAQPATATLAHSLP